MCGLEQNVALWALNKSILNIIIYYGLKGLCLWRDIFWAWRPF